MFRRRAGGCWLVAGASAGGVLAFDIETTGLDPEVCEVTCACAYDGRGVERGFVFPRDDPEGFLALLDEAPRLCAFNGVRFDLPFLAKRWGVPDERVGGWVRKLFDPFEACRLGLGRTFSLDRLLHANGLQGKTGSGLQAVEMARDGRWDELEMYCMHDTIMTHSVASMPACALPGQAPQKRHPWEQRRYPG